MLSESIVPAIVIRPGCVGNGLRQVVLSQSREVSVARIRQTSGRSKIHSHHVRTALVAGPVDDHLSAGLADRARRVATVLRSIGQSLLLLLGGQDRFTGVGLVVVVLALLGLCRQDGRGLLQVHLLGHDE